MYQNQLVKKSLIALCLSATIFTACKKDNATIENKPMETELTTTPLASENPVVTAEQARTGNQSPSAWAGLNQTITLPVNSITLDGNGSNDPDGSIVSYSWTKELGPAGTITSPSAIQTTVTALTAGDYRFKLTVTDNRGATGSDTIHIVVKGTGGTTPPANQSPVVNAGSPQTITLPVSSVTLSGSATDADGTIASYLWTKSSGTGGTITSANTASTTVTGLTAGSYVFDLKATDNAGATGNKTITITVNSVVTPPTNQIPVVNAGSSQTITLPVSSINLSGSATDPDGTIVSYLWTKTSGTGGNISNPGSTSTSVTGLTAGSYIFNLRATDNAGATGNKTVSITVNPAVVVPPPGGTYGTLIFSTGYDKLSDIVNGSGQQGNGGLSTSVYKVGPGSFKSVPANVSSGIRSEVQYDESQTPIEGVIEYDVLYEVVAQNYCHSLQFHPNSYDGSSVLGMWHSGGKFDVTRWYGGNNYHQQGTLQTIQTNRWYNMRVEYKFNNTTGYYRWYIDNVLYYSYAGQVGDGSGQYLKVGVNMWADQPSVVYYDNLKIWRK
jgi:hypothetical protein